MTSVPAVKADDGISQASNDNYFRIAVKPKLTPLTSANSEATGRQAKASVTQFKQNVMLGKYDPIDSPPFAQKVVDLINQGGNIMINKQDPGMATNVDDVYGLEQGAALSNTSSQQNFSLAHLKLHEKIVVPVSILSSNSPPPDTDFGAKNKNIPHHFKL